MFEEFFRALKVPGTPVKTFRLLVVLFPAAEEPMTPEELADAQHFFSASRCACRKLLLGARWNGLATDMHGRVHHIFQLDTCEVDL